MIVQLPDPESLERLCRSLAMLDAILMPDWEYRYYSFNSSWGSGQRMASMRNGQGDSWFILWRDPYVFLKGFDHESSCRSLSQPDAAVLGPVALLREQVPSVFAPELSEPAFMMEDTTFCRWWLNGQWHKTAEEPGQRACAEEMLGVLDGNPETYQRWAESYFDDGSPALEPVRQVYLHAALTESLVAAINPDVSLDSLQEDAREIGYPMGTVAN
ncbi:hypothetical protein IV102_00200 [bacterium]|nr:hypothetical protein [bacterium]